MMRQILQNEVTLPLAALAVMVAGWTAAWCAEIPITSGTEAIIPLETGAETRATTTTPPPRFDTWAPQPRLNCSLPAIEAWAGKNVHARTGVPRNSPTGDGPVQIIFSQRPFENAGMTKYSVIYQATKHNLADNAVWFNVAANFYAALRDILQRNEQFKTVQVSSPTVSTVPEMRRINLSYRIEKKSGERVSGAVLCAPVRRGVLFFNLALEGQEPVAVESAMRELRHAATIGLGRHTRSATPYVVVVLLAIPLVVAIVIVLKKRRALASGSIAE